MEPIDYELLERTTLTKIDNKTFAISCNDKIFYVGEILYDIMEMLKQGAPFNKIKYTVNDKFKVEINDQKLEETIKDCLVKLSNIPKANYTLYTYIYFRLRIIEENTLKKITPLFMFLFNKWLIVILFSAAFLCSFYFMGYIFTNGLLDQTLSIGKSLKYVLINYLFILFIGIFHEMGHSSASARNNIHSKEIGFGFYLIFPVFYTDISKIWLLDKNKRIVINFAGVYFQFIINALIVALFFLIDFSAQDKLLLKTLFITNCSICIYSLNPFMRNDGYWVYSDFFNIPNLTEAARKYPRKFFNNYILNIEKRNGRERAEMIRTEIPILIYSFLFNILIFIMVIGLAVFSYKNYVSVNELIHDQKVMSDPFLFENIYRILGLLFTLFINIFFMYRVFGQWINHLFNKKTSKLI